MSTEKTILPEFVIAQIYASHLVIGNDVQKKESIQSTASVSNPISLETTIPEPTIPFSFFGNNGKQITVLVREDQVPYINDHHLQFLSNVLAACKLNIGDIALINFNNHPIGFDELRDKTHPKVVLLFDINPKDFKLPFTIPLYQVQDYHQCQFLFAPALTKMEGDNPEAKAEKTKLWISLKKVFQL